MVLSYPVNGILTRSRNWVVEPNAKLRLLAGREARIIDEGVASVVHRGWIPRNIDLKVQRLVLRVDRECDLSVHGGGRGTQAK